MPKKKSASRRRRLSCSKGQYRKYYAQKKLRRPTEGEPTLPAEEDLEWETVEEPEDASVSESAAIVEPFEELTVNSVHDSGPFIVSSMDLSLSPVKAPVCPLFMKQVWNLLYQMPIPSIWFGIPRDSSLSFHLAPTPKATVIQRSLVVKRDGEVYFSVHNKPVEEKHSIWKLIPQKEVLRVAPVQDFAEHVFRILNTFNNFVVCPGNPDGQYGRYLHKVSKMVSEQNVFKEKYLQAQTFRSLLCTRLIPVAWKRCEACCGLRKQLERRIKAEQKSSPHRYTNHRYLLSPAWRKLVRKANRKVKAMTLKHSRCLNKMQRRIRDEGIYVGAHNNEKLMKTLCAVKDDSALSEAQQIFIDEQIKFNSLKNSKGMKWHPLLVRLGLQLQSIGGTSIIDAINSTKIFSLPSSRTLYDYSHAHKRDVNGGPCEPAISKLQKEMEQWGPENEFKKYHTLLIDEMTISSNLVISKSTGQLVGFVDMPDFRQSIEDFKNLLQQIDVGVDSEAEDDANELPEDVDDPGPSKVKKKRNPRHKRCDKASEETMATYHGKLPQKAKKMLTFMVRGLCSTVKEVVASYGVADLTADELYYKVWSVIEELEINGIYVLCITCDGSAINRKFINMHVPITKRPSKVVFDCVNTFACQPGRRLYFISDVPHLLKTIRNCFWKSRPGKDSARCLWKGGEYILWDTIKRLHNDEKGNTLRLAHKLQKQVVYLNSFSVMNVSYAAYVMSRTVANALVRMNYGGIRQTVEFIRRVNDFFDCLNGRSEFQAKRTRNQNLRPYRPHRHHPHLEDRRFQILMSFYNYLKDWGKEVKNSTVLKPEQKKKAVLSQQTLHGIEMTIFAFISATKFLFSQGARYVMARRFCQDPLEQYFSRQRASVGGGNNPTKFQYLNTERTYQIVKSLGLKRRGNTKYEQEGLSREVFEALPKNKRIRRPARGAARRSLSYSATEDAPLESECPK